jgi:hypothetical protein
VNAWKTFMISFLDGFTGEGIFGDLRIPGAPDRIFKEERADALSIEESRRLDQREERLGAEEDSEAT